MQLIGWWIESGTTTHWASCPAGTQASLCSWTGQLAVWPINVVFDPNLCPKLSGFVHENVKWRVVLISIIYIYAHPPTTWNCFLFYFLPKTVNKELHHLGATMRRNVVCQDLSANCYKPHPPSLCIWFLVIKTHRFLQLSLWGETQVCLLGSTSHHQGSLMSALGSVFIFSTSETVDPGRPSHHGPVTA